MKKNNKKESRMYISWKKDEELKVDLPYSGWLMFCAGTSMLISAIAELIK